MEHKTEEGKRLRVRFYDEGGHDCGAGKGADIPGRDVDVRDSSRIQVLKADEPTTLRSPYGQPLEMTLSEAA
jgi:hypothetical protein